MRFEAQFGVGTDAAQGLIDAKTLSIAKLMELLPPETLAVTADPTPFIYDTSWQAIAGSIRKIRHSSELERNSATANIRISSVEIRKFII